MEGRWHDQIIRSGIDHDLPFDRLCEGCITTQRIPQQAGQPMNRVKVATHIAATRPPTMAGDQQAVQANMHAMNEDFRKAIKLTDPARRVYRESARVAVRRVEGVRSVAWIDNTDVFVLALAMKRAATLLLMLFAWSWNHRATR